MSFTVPSQDVSSTVLKIVAASYQGLNVDPIDQVKEVVFSEVRRNNIDFHEEGQVRSGCENVE